MGHEWEMNGTPLDAVEASSNLRLCESFADRTEIIESPSRSSLS